MMAPDWIHVQAYPGRPISIIDSMLRTILGKGAPITPICRGFCTIRCTQELVKYPVTISKWCLISGRGKKGGLCQQHRQVLARSSHLVKKYATIKIHKSPRVWDNLGRFSAPVISLIMAAAIRVRNE